VPKVEGVNFGVVTPLTQWFQCRVERMWRHLACQVFIVTKFA